MKIQIKEHYFWFLSIIIVFFSFSIVSNKLIFNNKETLKQILSSDNKIKKALFPSKNNITQILIELIKNEQKSIKFAIFLITDKQIRNALIDAQKRNIQIDIITCHSNLNTIITDLVENGINVYLFGAPSTKKGMNYNPIMHNKFVIFEKNITDKSILWTGSFNFTCRAQTKNKENVIIIEDDLLISQYLDEYESIKNQSKSLVKSLNKNGFKKNNEPKIKMNLAEKFKETFRIFTG